MLLSFLKRKDRPEPALAGEPLTYVTSLGGELGDYAHDETLLAKATALARDRGATFSSLMLRHRGCLGTRWDKVWAVLDSGCLRLYKDQAAACAERTLSVKECDCHVGEREACKPGMYCFRLAHAQGLATFCAFNSKMLLLWLQALQASGVRYAEAPTAPLANISSLFQLGANLLSGEPIELTKYAGCVCLVVNVASK
jgi:hypothetical protein